METTLVYLTEDSPIPVSVEMEEPFRAVFSTQAAENDQLLLTAAQVESSAVTGDRAEMKYILRLQAAGVRKAEAEVITDVTENEASESPKGISIYFLQPGENAWDIARHYRIPLSAIHEINPEFSDDAAPGTPVIIYKR